MRKFFISFIFFVFLSLFLLNNNSAYAGPQCDALRGICKVYCDTTIEDYSQGSQDCESVYDEGVPVPQTCCVPKPTPTLGPQSGSLSDYEGQIPGVSCGVPNDKEGRNKCCVATNVTVCNQTLIDILDIGAVKLIASNLPIIGSMIYGFKDKCVETEQRINDFQSRYNSKCLYGEPKEVSGACTCQSTEIATGSATIAKMCYQYLDNSQSSPTLKKELKDCLICANKGKMWSGWGCISLDIKEFVGQILFTFGIGLGGLFALLCIIYSAFIMQTSGGNPEKIKRAQENLTSCIMGLMLIIFSVFILRLIGVDILKIPGFK